MEPLLIRVTATPDIVEPTAKMMSAAPTKMHAVVMENALWGRPGKRAHVTRGSLVKNAKTMHALVTGPSALTMETVRDEAMGVINASVIRATSVPCVKKLALRARRMQHYVCTEIVRAAVTGNQSASVATIIVVFDATSHLNFRKQSIIRR